MSGSGPIYEYQREVTVKLEQAIRERDEARAEVERLRGVDCGVTELDGTTTPLCGACLECAFLRGAEAMREAAASCVGGDIALLQTYRSVLERRIRGLPVPEDK